MGIEVSKVHMPVEFEIGEIEKDSRFQKVKIWVAHTGENLNNTYFTKELLTEMVSTLPYIPIVGFVEKNEDGENDFSDHRNSLVIESNKIKVEYQGKAYGFISDEPNAQFEFRGGKDWLTCEGYLWTKFSNATDIFNKSNGVKSQSMEIEDVEGEVDGLGRMVFSKGRFSALCILGEHVNPAMTGSTVEYFTTAKDSIREMIYEFSLQKGESILPEVKRKNSNNNDTSDEDLAKKEQQEKEAKEKADREAKEKADKEAKELAEKEAKEKEEREAKEKADKEAKELAEKEAADKEAKEKAEREKAEQEAKDKADKEAQEKADKEAAEAEAQAKAEEESKADESTNEPTDNVEDTGSEEFSMLANFELSHNQLRQNLTQLIRSAHQDDNKNVYVLEVFENRMIAEVYDWESDSQVYLEVGYSKDNETVVLGETKEVVSMFVTKDEKTRLETDRNRLVELESELSELQEFKTKSETEMKESVLEEYQEVLDESESASIREKFSELSVEGVEKEVAYACMKKSKGIEEFSGARSVTLGATNKTGRYGALDVYFNAK